MGALPRRRIKATKGARSQASRAASAPAPRTDQANGNSKAVSRHAVLKAAWCIGKKKSCTFLCGKSSWDTDEEEEDKAYRWAYNGALPDGTRAAANCWYCERTFANDFRHKNGRQELQKKLGKCKHTHDKFLLKKREFVSRRKSGKKQFKQREGGPQKLSHKEFDEDKLIRPRDFFWPLARYKKKHGDPRSKANRDLGHKVVKKYGHVGVVVPGDDGETPWIIERSRGSRLEKEEELNAGDDSDASEFAIDDQFDELVQDREDEHDTIACGILQSMLDKHSKPQDDEQSSKKGAKRKAPAIKSRDADDDGDADRVSRRRKLGRCVSDSSAGGDVRPARKPAGARSSGSGGAARSSKPPGPKVVEANSGSASTSIVASAASGQGQVQARLHQSQQFNDVLLGSWIWSFSGSTVAVGLELQRLSQPWPHPKALKDATTY